MQVPVPSLALILVMAAAGRMLAVPLKRRPTSELDRIYIASTLVTALIPSFAILDGRSSSIARQPLGQRTIIVSRREGGADRRQLQFAPI